jgi:hypothetical protein
MLDTSYWMLDFSAALTFLVTFLRQGKKVKEGY